MPYQPKRCDSETKTMTQKLFSLFIVLLGIVIMYIIIMYAISFIPGPKPDIPKCFQKGQMVKSVTSGIIGQVTEIQCNSRRCYLDVRFPTSNIEINRNLNTTLFQTIDNMQCFELEEKL